MQRNLKNKVICVFGLSFKKNTDDLRESSSMYNSYVFSPICSKLLIEGAYLQIYDPLANADKVPSFPIRS
jgi:UDP-glucose 6-dehydrogenase